MKPAISITLAMCLATAALPVCAQDQAATRDSQPGPLREAATREATRLARTLTATVPTPPQTAAEQSWAHRHPVLRDVLIGAAIGAGVGAVTVFQTRQESPWWDVVIYTASGAATGAPGRARTEKSAMAVAV